MKNISPKALIYALLTSMLFFTTNVMSTEQKVTTHVEVTQKKVHLNKSTVDDLQTLKGIGLKKAQAIVAYRQQMGAFKSVSELINVKGIGAKTFNDIKGHLKI